MNEHNFSYQKELEKLRFTPEQKQQMIAALAKEEQPEISAPKRRHPFVKIAVLSAAALSVLVVGAGATGVLKSLPDAFDGIFAKEQTEVADQIGYPIGASATDNGVTVTADAIIGDAYNACVVYTIQREDGKPLVENDPEHLFFEDSTSSITGMGGYSGFSYFFDQDPSDSAVQYVESITGDRPLKKGTVTVELKNLGWDTDDSSSQLKSIAKGDWKLKFRVDYEDSSIALPAGQSFEQNGLKIAVDELSISRVGIRVRYTIDTPYPAGEDNDLVERIFSSMPIQILKKDGTVLDMSGLGGSVKPKGNQTECQKNGMLPEIISLDDVVSVVIGGVTVPVTAS